MTLFIRNFFIDNKFLTEILFKLRMRTTTCVVPHPYPRVASTVKVVVNKVHVPVIT